MTKEGIFKLKNQLDYDLLTMKNLIIFHFCQEYVNLMWETRF